VAAIQGDHAAARAFYEKSLSLRREMGDKQGIAISLGNLGNEAWSQDDYAAARALYEESLSLRREMGDKWGIAFSLNALGNGAYLQGEYVEARAFLEACLALCQEMEEKTYMASALLGLGLVDLAEYTPDARGHILHSLRLSVEAGAQLTQTSSLIGVAGLVLHEGNTTQAAQLLGAVESALKVLNAQEDDDLIPLHAQTLAAVKAQLGAAAFQSAWEEGGGWSLEEAVSRALEEEK
jgi:tetratricopeptide (TPR) repeat protein